jgi:hypothetical protein
MRRPPDLVWPCKDKCNFMLISVSTMAAHSKSGFEGASLEIAESQNLNHKT